MPEPKPSSVNFMHERFELKGIDVCEFSQPWPHQILFSLNLYDGRTVRVWASTHNGPEIRVTVDVE